MFDIRFNKTLKIGPPPILSPTGTRIGNEPKCVANVSFINSGSTVKIVGVAPR